MPTVKIVTCPLGHRLFDLTTKTKGSLEIKCPKCRQIIIVELSDKIKTKLK